MTPKTLSPEALLETPAAEESPSSATTIAEHIAAAKLQGATHVDQRPNDNTTSRAKLYRLFWRWHFYAGMIVAPIILMASITGGLYVFIEELRPIMYPTLFRTAAIGTPTPNLTLAEISTSAARTYPNAKLIAVTPPMQAGLNAEVALQMPEGRRVAMVDPRSGRVVGLYDEQNSFFGIVLGLHRRLLLGTPGRITVELAASWGVILMITGTYLWWPRRAGRASPAGLGVWYPRLRGPLTVVLRDLHTVVGFYGLVTATIVLITGLFFTQFFGNGYKMLQNELGAAPPSMREAPSVIPQGRGRQISADDARRIAEPLLPGHGPVRVTFPAKSTDVFRVQRADNSSPTWKTTVFIAPQSGRVLDSYGWDDISTLHKIRFSIYPIHVGSIYGLPTKILALLTCMVLAILSVTGVWMWWRRRPRGTWGLAPSTANIAIPRWIVGLVVVLGVVMPAMGMSLVIILIGDFAVARYLNRRARLTAA